MSNKVGFVKQMWNNFKKSLVIYRTKDIYIGSDEFGNQYYERKHDETKNLKRQRKVVPLSKDLSEVPNVPVEWMTWLQGRRDTPPSDEEMLKNKEESLKIMSRVAILEDKSEDPTRALSPAQQAALSKKFPTRPQYENVPGEHQN